MSTNPVRAKPSFTVLLTLIRRILPFVFMFSLYRYFLDFNFSFIKFACIKSYLKAEASNKQYIISIITIIKTTVLFILTTYQPNL